MNRRVLINVATVAMATVLFHTASWHVGRVGEMAAALDGRRVLEMTIASGLTQGDPTLRTRPLVPAIARAVTASGALAGRIADTLQLPGDDTQRTFELLNRAFAGVLAALLCWLLDAHGASAPMKVIAVLNAFLTMAIVRVPAYEPVQIELGACVFVTMAICAIVSGRRWAMVPATVLAVAAGAVGVLVVVFGLCRDWRQGVGRFRSVATYAPAIVTFVALQAWAYGGASHTHLFAPLLDSAVLVRRAQFIGDPRFLLLATYGIVTLFGGVSLWLLAQFLRRRLTIDSQVEWIAYLGSLLIVSLIAGAGIWGVLAYSLPAVAVLFSRAAPATDWRELAMSVGLATLATQRPWAPLNDIEYLWAWAPHLSIARNSVFVAPHAWISWVGAGVFVVWFVWWVARDRRGTPLVACGVGAAVLLLLLSDVTGHISVHGGLGWDGEDYVRIVERGFGAGMPSMRLRPMILFVNSFVDGQLFQHPLATFSAMNLGYAFVLGLTLADLSRRYGASPGATAVLVLNLFLCISVAKLFAYYPTLIDLGAYAATAACVWAIVIGRRLPIVVTSVLAILSREFAAVTVLFGIARDVRKGRSLLVIAATYAPAAMAFLWVRHFAAAYSQGAASNDPVLSVGPLFSALLENIEWWGDPAYALFWVYFVLTLFGGVSLLLLTTSRPWRTCLRAEPEWLAYIVPLLVVTALGYLDMWRYSAFLVPAVPAFWSWAVAGVRPGRELRLYAAVTAATLVTQRPWQHMGLDSYFRDWFPYYLVITDRVSAPAQLWPLWRAYIFLAALCLLGLVAMAQWAENPHKVGSSDLPVS